MSKIYYDEKGIPHPFPIGLGNAKKAYSRRYIGEPCSQCGKTTYYTKSQKCALCALRVSTDFYAYSVGQMTWQRDPSVKSGVVTVHKQHPGRPRVSINREIDALEIMEIQEADGLFPTGPPPTSPAKAIELGENLWVRPEPCTTHGHLGVRTLNNQCYYCSIKEPSPRQVAIAGRRTWYTPTEPCPKCGQIAPKRVADGRCKGCMPLKRTSPRQEAVKAGLDWYTPTEPCPKCGQIAPKRVNNGQCSGCTPATTPQPRTPSSKLMQDCPDLIISREDARALGFKVYRTGRPCINGHKGWRYISTNNCISC